MLFKLEKVGSIASQVDPAKAYIVRLDALEKPDEKTFEDKKAAIASSLERKQSSHLVEGFVASLHRNGKISISESMENTTQEDDYRSTDDYL